MTDLTLDKKREQKELAKSAVDEIRELTTQYNIKLSAVITELEEETSQMVFDGDWVPQLENFEDELVSKINGQFECI